MWLSALVHDPLTRIIAQIIAIILVSRVLGLLTRRVSQPMVIAEITAGILLGPSLLGWLSPDTAGVLFEKGSLGTLQVVSQVGLVLFMFLIGLELDPKLLRGRAHTSVAISHASIVVPFGLGAGLAWWLYPRLSDPSVPFAAFTLFLGAAMSITAFPVLARILSERRLLRSRVGTIAIACAAVDDVTAWCILAFVVAVARATGLAAAATTTALALAYIAVMFGVIRPLLQRLASRVSESGGLSQNAVAVVMLLLFGSAWMTELIGIHALFGAFLLGAVLPKEGGFAHALADKLEDLVLVVLLPLFFAFSGVRTELGLLDSATDWLICGAIILAASIGKFGASALAARFTGLSWRESGALGILMNTRGLMELIVLNIGLDLGVISPTLFAMMVVMALVTTFVTSPVLEWVYPQSLLERDALAAAPEPADLVPVAPPYRVLVCVASGRSGPGLVTLAGALQGRGDGNGAIEALHLLRANDRASFILEQEHDDGNDNGLRPLLDRAHHLGLRVRPTRFVSGEPAHDIARVAEVKRADLVLMGWHRPVVSQTMLGGIVHDVMKGAGGAVGVFVDRGLDAPRRVLVPYRGSPNDRAALGLAARLMTHAGSEITVLAMRGANLAAGGGDPLEQALAEAFGADPGRVARLQCDADNVVAAVLEESGRGYDLVVVGVGRDWGLEQRLVGLQPERLMHESPTSLLVVRGAGPSAV